MDLHPTLQRLWISKPIFQAPIGGVATPELAAAVWREPMSGGPLAFVLGTTASGVDRLADQPGLVRRLSWGDFRSAAVAVPA